MIIKLSTAKWAVVVGALCLLPSSPSDAGCPTKEANKAEASVDKLDSWEKVHSFFKAFGPCDDGGVAEGVTESITKLLAQHPDQSDRLVGLIKADPAFEAKVIEHIDTTARSAYLEKIRTNYAHQCLPAMAALCKKLVHAATEAIRGM